MYDIKEADFRTELHMYKLGNEVFASIYNRREALLLNDKGYVNLSLSQPIKLSHFEQLEGKEDEFITAEFDYGFGHYKIDRQNQKVDLIRRYDK